LPALIVPDASPRREESGKITNDDIINQEMASPSTKSSKSSLTLPEMKAIADSKNIQYHPSISFDEMHQKLYG